MNLVTNKESKLIPLKGKASQVKWKTERIPYEDESKYQDLGFVVPKGYLIVESKTKTSTSTLETFFEKNGVKPFSYETTKGKQFILKIPKGLFFDDLISSIKNGTIFKEDEKSNNIEVNIGSRNGKESFVVIKSKGESFIKIDKLLKSFNEKTTESPISLLLQSKWNISLYDFNKETMNKVSKRWMVFLKPKHISKKQFIKLLIEINNFKEIKTTEDMIKFAESVWKQTLKDEFPVELLTENSEMGWRKGFVWKVAEATFGENNDEVRTFFQAIDILDYKLISDYIIEQTNLQISKDDEIFWGIVDGKFSIIKKLRTFIGRFLTKELGNVKPSVISNLENYISDAAPVKSFDDRPLIVTFKNKTINAETLEEEELEDNKMNRNIIPWNYVGKLPRGYEKEKKFLDNMMGKWTVKDKKIEKELYELIGLSMTKYIMNEKAYFLLGNANNGKSFFLKFLGKILGLENISVEDLKNISNDKFASSELYGKLANINTDISAALIEDPSLFKKIVSGEYISAQYKHAGTFKFAPYANQIFGTNSIPYTRESGDSDAITRRLKIIVFNAKFKNITEKKKQVLQDELHSERVIELAISRGLRAFSKAYGTDFTVSKSTQDAIDNHVREMNHVIDFIEQNKPQQEMIVIELFEKYTKWCTDSKMYRHLAKTNFVKKYINAARYRGLTIHNQITPGDNSPSRHKLIVEDN